MNSRYLAWLQKQGVPLYKAGGVYWELYKGTLIPASIGPCFVTITGDEARSLLQDSGAWFLRYSTSPCEEETEWWYIVCDSYDPKRLSSNSRSKINRGNRNCSVRRIDPEWLADNGYGCHLAAYNRYKNATPAGEEKFRENVLASIGGPVEYWGVFVDQSLAGYCQCVLDDDNLGTSVVKFDPAYLKQAVGRSARCSTHLLEKTIREHLRRPDSDLRTIAGR